MNVHAPNETTAMRRRRSPRSRSTKRSAGALVAAAMRPQPPRQEQAGPVTWRPTHQSPARPAGRRQQWKRAVALAVGTPNATSDTTSFEVPQRLLVGFQHRPLGPIVILRRVLLASHRGAIMPSRSRDGHTGEDVVVAMAGRGATADVELLAQRGPEHVGRHGEERPRVVHLAGVCLDRRALA